MVIHNTESPHGDQASLKPVGGRLGLPGNAVESATAATVAANSGLWTLGFKQHKTRTLKCACAGNVFPSKSKPNLYCVMFQCLPGKPVVVMTWRGTNPALPSLVLNSHTDVVPVYPVSSQTECYFMVMSGD